MIPRSLSSLFVKRSSKHVRALSSSIKFRKDRVRSALPAQQQQQEYSQSPPPPIQEPSAMAQIGSMFALGFGMFVGIALVRYVFFGFPKPNKT